MKYLNHILGILCAFCLMVIFLITSVEAVAYWTPGYYEAEYTKYGVADTVHMEMDDLLDVTDEMMAYLRGNREDLHVPTIVDGQPREFFNEREIAHMEDVRGLFLAAIALRRICVLVILLCLGLLIWRKAPLRRLLPRMLCAGASAFLLLTVLLAGIISTDFTKYFVIFHKIFFNNDLWILNPDTDLLINIVPEPFFMDTAARIGLTFAGLTALLFGVCIFLIRKTPGDGANGPKNTSKHDGSQDAGKSADNRTKQAHRAGRKTGLHLLLCLTLLGSLLLGSPRTVYASTDWPSDVSIESDAGIVMDAASGAVLYGKNIHETYAPASITKVLTALIVLERCSLDEMVTFSQNAVYNVEENSSSAGYDTGDTATVKDCLYALLLKSANESANALAEHVAGSTDAFAVLMNEKASQLGCQDSHFSNPSGLNDDAHYVSAYDMALITRAAFENDTFAAIVSTTYYELPPNKQNPEGQGISPGNKMIKKNWPDQYRPDVIGGKTGYTSIALNTLVNGAQQGDTRLITVILHSSGTQYDDTKRLLDFGFSNFQSVRIADYDKTFSSIGDDLKIAGLSPASGQSLTVDPESRVILPRTADFSETTASLDYTLPADAPEGAIACIRYTLGERNIGQAYLTFNTGISQAAVLPARLIEAPTSTLALGEGLAESVDAPNDGFPAEGSAAAEQGVELTETVDDEHGTEAASASSRGLFHISLKLPSLFWKLLITVLLLAGTGTGLFLFFKKRKEAEERAAMDRRRRRIQRLRETGISEAEFDLMIQERRRKKEEL